MPIVHRNLFTMHREKYRSQLTSWRYIAQFIKRYRMHHSKGSSPSAALWTRLSAIDGLAIFKFLVFLFQYKRESVLNTFSIFSNINRRLQCKPTTNSSSKNGYSAFEVLSARQFGVVAVYRRASIRRSWSIMIRSEFSIAWSFWGFVHWSFERFLRPARAIVPTARSIRIRQRTPLSVSKREVLSVSNSHCGSSLKFSIWKFFKLKLSNCLNMRRSDFLEKPLSQDPLIFSARQSRISVNSLEKRNLSDNRLDL